MLDLKSELCLLADKINWEVFEKSFESLYHWTGRPAKRIRVMVSLLLLKQIFDVSDEKVVKIWKENPYWQYFSGESHFQLTVPCEASDLVHFRKRIGAKGVEKIFRESILIHGKDVLEKKVIE